MNLTEEQLDLLKKIVRVYNSGCKASFQLIRVHNPGQSGLVFLGGGPKIPSDLDKADLMQLASEGFLQIDTADGLVKGKITQSGLAAVFHLPSLPPRHMAEQSPIPVPFPLSPSREEQPPVPKVTSEPPRPLPHVVFIGHGHGKDWIELDQFLTKKLKLSCIDFNSSAAAGLPTQTRLEQMLDQATFAFLVLTAEDPQPDGSLQARQNVIHEVGLFQGRLGFDKAILLVEAGCKGFSNIHGLTYISFRAGEIKGSFHEVREVLEDRGIIVH